MMMLSKLKVGLVVLGSAGFVAAGSGMLAAQGPGGGAVAPASSPVTQKAEGVAGPFRPRSAADLAKARVDNAMQRFKLQKDFYDQGRITIDRLADSSRTLMDAERDAAGSKAGRVEAVRAHHARLQDILEKEQAELEAGRATEADVTEIKSVLLDSEYALARELEAPEGVDAGPGSSPTARTRPADLTALARLANERVERYREQFELVRDLYRNARIEVDQPLETSQRWMDLEIDAATTAEGRLAAIRAHLARLDEIKVIEEVLRNAGRSPRAAVMDVQGRRLDAEYRLARESANPGPVDLERRVSDVERKLDRVLNLLDALGGPPRR